MKDIVGIYCITNDTNGKKYVGSSTKIASRWSDHRARLNMKEHCNSYLQRAWDKSGPESFSFSILHHCSLEELESQELHWILKLGTHSRSNGYNLQTRTSRSILMDDSVRKKKSKAAKAQWARMKDKMKSRIQKSWDENRSSRLAGCSKSGLIRRDNRRVAAYSLDGKLLRTYGCRREAYLENGKDRNIYRVLSGTFQQYKGVRYEYLD